MSPRWWRPSMRTARLTVAAGRGDVADVSLPPSLRLTILRRISSVGEDALGVLRARRDTGLCLQRLRPVGSDGAERGRTFSRCWTSPFERE